ncbi:PucR family transcriptional regulator [Sporolactobacillus sp. THM7-4]|nr:PucR family transcriptional regulator [Sporolactobacillus sp. THM7-4]
MITLRKLFSLAELAPIRLVAGKTGINRPITGVNVTESNDLTEFIRPNELIITTGINMANQPEKVITMVETAYRCKTAGIVLNVGPFIPEIPEQVLRFADERQYPVFRMPWEYRVADFVKLTVQFLATEQILQTRTKNLLSELLFNPEPDHKEIVRELQKKGIHADDDFGIIVCAFEAKQAVPQSLVYAIEGSLSEKFPLLLSMTHKNQCIYMVNQLDVRGSLIPFSKTVEDIYRNSGEQTDKINFFFGIGSFYRGITHLSKSYNEALTVIHLNQRHPEHLIYEYKNIGAYKIIMDVRHRHVLDGFHKDLLGPLYRYDQLHGTDLVRFLRIYIEEDGRTANIAKREFVHRNTVLYKIKKIESILDMDICLPFTKTNLSLAFMIEDVIE